MSTELDFFNSSYGQYQSSRLRRPIEMFQDMFSDLRLRNNPAYRLMRKNSEAIPSRNVLVVGVEVPSRSEDLKKVLRRVSESRHRVTAESVPLRDEKGKYQNINAGLLDFCLDDFDWLIVLDDDVALPSRFLDNFLYVAESANLQLCQPAHTLHSFQSYNLTRRESNCLARVTHFVECGPLTAFHRSIFRHVVPFPELRWAWGTDIYWSELAQSKEFRLGVVDCTPVTHLRRLGRSYDGDVARNEAIRFLQDKGVHRSRESILKTVEMISHF